MKPVFYIILANSLVASFANTLVWFGVTHWVYLQTHSVLATSVMAGIYLVTVAISGFFLGSLVDRYRKKTALLISSVGSLILYALAYLIYLSTPATAFMDASSIVLWEFIIVALVGAIAGNLRTIALPTLITVLIPEAECGKANGVMGTVNGVAFLAASIVSGLTIGFWGMYWMLVIAISLTVLSILHLCTIVIPEQHIIQTKTKPKHIDIRGTIQVIRLVPGLFALIFFNCFNNFLGGIFMSLIDAYGLSLVSVQMWGIMRGFLSLGFIVGGLGVARFGLGKSPLQTIFLSNIVMWIVAMGFTIQPSIILLAAGLLVYLCLIPVVEASEQMILQTMIPLERQGRVFGFAQSVEQSASPLTAFMIGPIAHFLFIPFMTTGAGVDLIGPWFGTGSDRGIALLFSLTGLGGLVVTVLAMRSRAYRTLSVNYQRRYTNPKV